MNIQTYHKNSSNQELWKQAIGKIIFGLDRWLQTDIKKSDRLIDLQTAQELVDVFVNNIDHSHEYGAIMQKIFQRISWDITQALLPNQSFEHTKKSFDQNIAGLRFISSIL